MKVQDVMTRSPSTCLLQDTLDAAAQKLWERDCGCLPVVDPDGRPLAMLTDRDVCMAAWTTGKPLHELQVGAAMSKQLVSCRAAEELGAAAARMSKHGVRRLPVIDHNGVLAGIVSLNDLALASAKEPPPRGGALGEAVRVLLAVSAHRMPPPAATAAGPTVPVAVAPPAPPTTAKPAIAPADGTAATV